MPAPRSNASVWRSATACSPGIRASPAPASRSVERPWNRLEVGGKPQGQVFLAGTPERRTAAVTSNGQQVAVVSGIEQLTIMRTSGLAPARPRPGDEPDPSGVDDGLQRLLVATLSARWTYTSGDVTFDPYRQGVRAAIVETFGCQASRSVQHTLYAHRRRRPRRPIRRSATSRCRCTSGRTGPPISSAPASRIPTICSSRSKNRSASSKSRSSATHARRSQLDRLSVDPWRSSPHLFRAARRP